MAIDAAKLCFVAGLKWRSFCGCGGNGYTLGMDSVRFGRALGIGARAAAKTLVTAVDAATSPNPSAEVKAKQAAGAAQVEERVRLRFLQAEAAATRRVEKAARTTARVRQTRQGLKEGGKRFGEAMWGAAAKASGALWLELTGVFFGIFAVFAATGAWKMRGALLETAANHEAHGRLLISVAMAALFGYFCVSSFVRANRRSRGR